MTKKNKYGISFNYCESFSYYLGKFCFQLDSAVAVGIAAGLLVIII